VIRSPAELPGGGGGIAMQRRAWAWDGAAGPREAARIPPGPVDATALVTLYAKAGESRLPDSLLRDTLAAAVADRLADDPGRFAIPRDTMIGVAARAQRMDGWARDFLRRHPDALVLHLGCGLDTRVFRVAPPATARWIELDLPPVIALRRRLLPPRPGTSLVAASVTDAAWLALLPRERPALVLAEGLLPYLPAPEVPRLLRRLTGCLPRGEIGFDAYGGAALLLLAQDPTLRAAGAVLRWALDDPHALERQVPGLRLIEDSPGQDPAQLARMSWPTQLALGVLAALPCRLLGRFLRYAFGAPSGRR